MLVRFVTESHPITVGCFFKMDVLGLTALCDSISVYTKSSSREGERRRRERIDKRKTTTKKPSAFAVSPADRSPTINQISG